MSDAFKDAVIRDHERERDGLQFVIRAKEEEIDRLSGEVERLKLRLAECRRGWREND